MKIWNYLGLSPRNCGLKKAGIIQTGPGSPIFGTEIPVQDRIIRTNKVMAKAYPVDQCP